MKFSSHSLVSYLSAKKGFEDLLTSYDEAVEELTARQHNKELRAKVQDYLKNDIPEYFQSTPILYMARHVATPNFETLRFMHLSEVAAFPSVIGQDTKDKFVPMNPLKKVLGKMPIMQFEKQRDHTYREQYEQLRVVDFNIYSGSSFDHISTLWGENIVDFHNQLLRNMCSVPVKIVDDSSWIDRHHRGDLLNHYKDFLSLFIVHGILFEDYVADDLNEQQFVKNVLRPAFAYVSKQFGVRPLITHLTPPGIESSKYWISYPYSVRDQILEKKQELPEAASQTTDPR